MFNPIIALTQKWMLYEKIIVRLGYIYIVAHNKMRLASNWWCILKRLEQRFAADYLGFYSSHNVSRVVCNVSQKASWNAKRNVRMRWHAGHKAGYISYVYVWSTKEQRIFLTKLEARLKIVKVVKTWRDISRPPSFLYHIVYRVNLIGTIKDYGVISLRRQWKRRVFNKKGVINKKNNWKKTVIVIITTIYHLEALDKLYVIANIFSVFIQKLNKLYDIARVLNKILELLPPTKNFYQDIATLLNGQSETIDNNI